MPDGILPAETTAPELAAETADSRLLRHVRRNLVLWSGGTTLVILLVLAAALYVAGRAVTYDDAVEQAKAAIDAGAGIVALDRLRVAFARPSS